MQVPHDVTPIDPLAPILERHDREHHAFKLLTEPEKAREQVRARVRYAASPWDFLADCVYTLDQVNQNSPIKLYPSYLEYTKFLAYLWQKEKLLAIPKSRRMICSWTMISLYAHDTFFNSGRFNAFASKKEDDSADLVSRAEFIYNKIPEWRIPRQLLPALKNGKMSKQPPLMEFEEIHSKIQGFAQGSDQMRQFTFSGLLFDEWAFWEQAQSSYSAARPTLEGGGRLTGISSRSPGFFKRIVFDQLDAEDLNFREIPPVTTKHPMEGVEVWRNPKNGFVVVDLHYTADPKKRSKEWRNAIKSSMPARDFAMEYERSWQTHSGLPVFPDFNRTIHVKQDKFSPDVTIPLIISFDFGLTPACLVGQLQGRQLFIIKEFQELNGSISKLAPVVWAYLQQNYRHWMVSEGQILTYIDPAGFQKAQTDARTCADVLMKQGFTKILPGPVVWEQRKRAVEEFLTKTYSEGAALQVSADCPILIESLAGGYRYPDKATEIEPAQLRPIKDKFSHLSDCLQYLCSGTIQLRKSYGIKIATPSYSFQGTA